MYSAHAVKSNCIWSFETCFVKAHIHDMYDLLHAHKKNKYPVVTKEKINPRYAKEDSVNIRK